MKTTVVQPGEQLVRVIRRELEGSSETVVLAALVTDGGLQSILGSLKRAVAAGCEVEFIFGTCMPTPSSPEALGKLFRMHDDRRFRLLWYKGPLFYHPKLFLFRHRDRFSVLLGSSNFSEGGLRDNIEFNSYIRDVGPQDQPVSEILRAIHSIRSDAAEISSKWLARYTKRCARVHLARKTLAKEFSGLAKDLQQERTLHVRRWDQLVSAAIAFKGTDAYEERRRGIPDAIARCRQTIGDPRKPAVVVERWRHKNQLGLFGTLDSRQFSKTIPKNANQTARLNETLRHLLDQKLTMETRLRDTLDGRSKYHLRGMGISIASDILNKYYPDQSIVYNAPIAKALRSFGVRFFPADQVEAYLRVTGIYQRLLREAAYPKDTGYALLDQFLWIRGHKIIYGWA